MAGWDWLNKHNDRWPFVRNVFIKTLLLFIILNTLYIVLAPLPFLSRLTFYNLVIPGRERLPFSENPEEAYNLSLHRIEGMFASHVINEEPADDEFRVVFIGDSSVWGWLLEPDETLTACLNAGDYQSQDGRRLVAYNLGYPVLSAMKDALILDYALEHYDPDAVVWMVSLQSFFEHEQMRHPITDNNPERTRDIIQRFSLNLDTSNLADDESLLDRSIYGQRRELADLLRYQVYGVAWWLTGIDHTNPLFYRIRSDEALGAFAVEGNSDLSADPEIEPLLAIDVIEAVFAMTAQQQVPILMVNEPILRLDESVNANRYNYYYPRKLYDRYREFLQNYSDQQGWNYINYWDAVPNEAFTDTPLHFTPDATCNFAALLAPDVINLANPVIPES